MKINTEQLKKALDFLSMGIAKSNDKYETLLVELETSNGRLKGYTNDGVNKLGVRICDTTENFNATLKFDILYSLVKSCKEEEFTLEAGKNYATFTTPTFSCKLLVFDTHIARVKMVQFTDKVAKDTFTPYLPVIKTILNPNHVVECYRYVFFGDYIMVTDTDNIAVINEKIFNNILISYHSLEILNYLGDFEYAVGRNGDGQEVICAFSDDRAVEIAIMDKTDYQYDDLIALFNNNSTNSVILKKESLSLAINYASLFDSDKVDLIFSKNGVTMEIPSADLKYVISSEPCEDMKYSISIDLMKKFLIAGDEIKICYDDSTLIYVSNDAVKTIYGVEET